ncbi:hydrogenase large subunit [Rhodobacter ferrooxidans]|uniref:Putative formate hydrogenlyase subunit 5 n=1 Tax=Rhodobacter ferrooxidans TaxID=371731 RepID=C8S038_9RHOB|nr:NADH-quinone oxidoreductase subunit C [Rhodobacter sp. SW2]EEW25647.1 putative formate hydrogenlyase subunit 5 precursor [Rhodobacter sp. SW2]
MTGIHHIIDTDAAMLRAAPMPRASLSRTQWTQVAEDLAGGKLTLLSLWGSKNHVYMALLDEALGKLGVVSLFCRSKHFPSIGLFHPAAQRLERAACDLFGLVAEGAAEARPWLDHGRWLLSHPMGEAGPAVPQPPYAFLPVQGDSLHQVAVGPVHAGIIEPGHFRFTVQGETVVRLEERLGYVHKGIGSLMHGASLARGVELAGRTSGDSTVAYAWAFSQAAEAALGAQVPARALWLRALMAELERLANHLGDVGAVCNDAAFALMLAHCSVLREQVLRACDAAFGHRMMRDGILPGGVSRDLDAAGVAGLRALVAGIAKAFPPLVALFDDTTSLQDRVVSTGKLVPDLARRFGAGGHVGRASGRNFDTRRNLPYAPYDQLEFKVPGRSDGDVAARVWQRIDEVFQSLALVTQILDRLPDGPIYAEPPAVGEQREGLGLVESFRGDVLVWLTLDAQGRVLRCHMRDPSWFQWPLLEAVIEGNIIADFPLCNKSFNCSYSGHDL